MNADKRNEQTMIRMKKSIDKFARSSDLRWRSSMTTFTFCRTSGDIWGSWRGGGGSKIGAGDPLLVLGPEPVGG